MSLDSEVPSAKDFKESFSSIESINSVANQFMNKLCNILFLRDYKVVAKMDDVPLFTFTDFLINKYKSLFGIEDTYIVNFEINRNKNPYGKALYEIGAKEGEIIIHIIS